jgi:hypothetical protein
MKTPQILIDAQNEWPEDEANLTANSHRDRQENGYTREESDKVLTRDILHMHKVFSFEDDANELVDRYNAELLKRGIDVKTVLFWG